MLHHRPTRDIGVTQGLREAVKADKFSIASFRIDLLAGRRVYQEALFAPELAKTTAAYRPLMRLATIVGFFTARPANGRLIRAGRKERM
ncbi:DUF4396 domain-containing protein [Streptomyces sp. NPDC048417]|uniref:DUF4396 domain-containing protein n=1 Tax=Streptomyces sp. NPDC048417 TaxID=3155387 RepID=UPI003445F08E